jgi:hypothetical protein
MRLRPDKIDLLTELVYQALEANEEIHLTEPRERVIVLIRQIIMADLQAEDDIEAEARERLDEYRTKIEFSSMSYDSLLQKAMATIAKERKMVL